jgi:hypothetical protein
MAPSEGGAFALSRAKRSKHPSRCVRSGTAAYCFNSGSDVCARAAHARDVPRQSIELRDYQPGVVLPAGGQRLFKFWAVIPLAALNRDKLADQLPVAVIEVALDCRSLRFRTVPTLALLVGRDSK